MITKRPFREAPLPLGSIRPMHQYPLTWLIHTKYVLVENLLQFAR
jgi:hypothetical protein